MSPEGLQNPSLTLAVAGGRGGSLEVADVSHEPVGCVPWRPLSRFLSLPSARSDAPAATFPDGRSSLRARFGLLATALDEPLPFFELWPYLQQHGSHCLAWSYFQAGLRHFLLPGVGFVAYTPMQQPAYTQVIVLGAPVCSKESVGQLLRVFLSRYPRAMFMQIPHELGAHLSAEHGYLVNALGGETQLDVSSYSYKGNNKKALRLVAAKAKRSGLVVEEVHRPGLGPLGSGQGRPGCMASVPQRAPGAALSPGLAAQLRRVSEEWMEGKGLSAKGAWFLVRRPTFELEAPGTRTFVAWQHASATAHPTLPAASKHLPPLATTTPSLLQRLRSHLSGGPPCPSPHQASAYPFSLDSSTCCSSHSTSTPACPPHAGTPPESHALARTVSAMGSGAALLPAHQRHDSAAAAAAALRSWPAAALSLPTGLELPEGPGLRGAAAAPEEGGAVGGGGVGHGCGDVWAPEGGRHVVGFVVLDPMWDQGRVTGYYANIVRAGRGSHSGTSALLIQEIMAIMKEEQQQQQQQQQQLVSGSVLVPGGGGGKEGRVSQRQRLKAAKAARAAQDADLTLQAQGQGRGQGQGQDQGQGQGKGEGQGTVQVPVQGRGKGKGKGKSKGQGVAQGQGQGLAALQVKGSSCGPGSLAPSPTALKAVTAVQSLAAAVSVYSVPLPLPCEPPTPPIKAVPLTALGCSRPATPVDDPDSLESQQLWKVEQEGQQQQQQLAGGKVACKAGGQLLEGCEYGCQCESLAVPEIAALSSNSSSAGSSGSTEVVALCMPIKQQHPQQHPQQQQQQQQQQQRHKIEYGGPNPCSLINKMNLEHQNGRGNLAGKPGVAGEKVPSTHSISAPVKKDEAAATGGGAAGAAAAAAAGVRGGGRAGGCRGQSGQSPAAPKPLLLPQPQGTTSGEVPAPASGSQPVATSYTEAPGHSLAVAAAEAGPGLVKGWEEPRLTEGQLVLTLGMSPLYCLVEERRSHVFKYSKLVRAILKSTYKLGTPFYPYKTLAAAKARYGGGASGLEARGQYDDPATRWLPMYIAMPPGATLTGQDMLQMGVTTGMLKGLFHCSKVLMREALGKALRKTGSLKKKAAEGRGEEDGGRDQDRDV